MKALLLAVACMLAAGAAWADGRGDAQAGLEALNRGDNDEAIRLLSSAISSGELRGDDLEFGYACRGRAWLNKSDAGHAIVDLDQARRMKPDDADAENDLEKALATKLPVSEIPGVPKESLLHALGRAVAQDLVNDLQNSQPQ